MPTEAMNLYILVYKRDFYFSRATASLMHLTIFCCIITEPSTFSSVFLNSVDSGCDAAYNSLKIFLSKVFSDTKPFLRPCTVNLASAQPDTLLSTTATSLADRTVVVFACFTVSVASVLESMLRFMTLSFACFIYIHAFAYKRGNIIIPRSMHPNGNTVYACEYSSAEPPTFCLQFCGGCNI